MSLSERQSLAETHRLSARYTDDQGTVVMTGLQALARLPIEQLRADRDAGHRTAALLTGYPGSPLGGLDVAFDEAINIAGQNLAIHHLPAVNEEQGATAIMGSQLACTRPDALYDGVIGIWYGKAPGVDRASDAIRHGVFAGADPRGGAVVIAGDDPAAKSSTIPSSSAGVLAAMHVPLLYPGTPADVLRLGRHAIALSRCTGLWTSLKIVADVADDVSTVTLDPSAVNPVIPTIDGKPYAHKSNGYLLTPHTVDVEREIYEVRYELSIEYAKLNNLNAITVDPSDAWLGIVAAGNTYRELREALRRLGLTHDSQLADAGIRLLCMDMPLPFSAERARGFAAGLEEILVVEEKHPNIESLLKDALYHSSQRPLIVGKRDENERLLFSGHGALNADDLIEPLRERLSDRLGERLIPPSDAPTRINIPVTAELSRAVEPLAQRTPFFCSGCPHNRSVRVPDGAVVGVGIGCHTMALLLRPDQVGDLVGLTSMGQEGTQWIGMAPFVETPHIYQNLGDGTYFHSGKLAIAGSVAAGVNLTYKLLWNRHVAMTGGQDPQGAVSIGDVCRSMLSVGVARVLITTDDTGAYRRKDLPSGVDVWDRRRLIEAQELLAATEGVTVLVHDQQCAAEARRERKRGTVPMPSKSVVINERICEGCGDCAQISNCLSVQPVETFFGDKTRIDQTSCNLDFSCLEGDCPSFMELRRAGPLRARLRKLTRSHRAADERVSVGLATAPTNLPEPAVIFTDTDELAVRMCGIGGTGVVTISRMLGTAAMFDGYQSRGLDQIGLSQKAGPVVGDLRLSRSGEITTSRVGARQADVLLAFDQLVAASTVGVDSCEPGHTVVVGSTTPTPTGAMITDAGVKMPTADELADELAAAGRPDAQHWVDATATTLALLGSSVTANVFVVGMAVQCGGLPLSPESVREAIKLNGVSVEANLAAFDWGRTQIAAPHLVVVGDSPSTRRQDTLPKELRALVRNMAHKDNWPDDLTAAVGIYTHELVQYQSTRLAQRYLDTLSRLMATAHTAAATGVKAGTAAGDTAMSELTAAIAAGLFKLTAYKDEYEVARLMLSEQATAEARRVARNTDSHVVWMLHPPLLRALGLKRKIGFSTTWRLAFSLLVRMRRLRGHWCDPFGHSGVRRIERSLVGEYTEALFVVLRRLGAAAGTGDQACGIGAAAGIGDQACGIGAAAGIGDQAWQTALDVANAPDVVRGYEHIKLENVNRFRALLKAPARA